MKIYLASSWRNQYQADVLASLRGAGFEVYDFKNPAPGNVGFGWKQIDPDLAVSLTVPRLRNVLAHPIASAGFRCDFDAMKWADACVLLLPSGMSAHLEAGWFSGAGKPVAICAPEIREPELMYKCFDDVAGATPLFATVDEVIEHLRVVHGEMYGVDGKHLFLFRTSDSAWCALCGRSYDDELHEVSREGLGS